MRDTCKTGNSKCDIASNFLSLVKEEVLVAIVYFLEEFFKKFWNTHFIIMQQHDSIIHKSRHIARPIALQYYAMKQELLQLEASYHLSEEFLPFLSRKNLYSPDEQHKLRTSLPTFFFNESEIILTKYFNQ